MALYETGRALPKFGEWDENDPASAEGFSVIFNKARDERKTGVTSSGNTCYNHNGHGEDKYEKRSSKRKWFCCC